MCCTLRNVSHRPATTLHTQYRLKTNVWKASHKKNKKLKTNKLRVTREYTKCGARGEDIIWSNISERWTTVTERLSEVSALHVGSLSWVLWMLAMLRMCADAAVCGGSQNTPADTKHVLTAKTLKDINTMSRSTANKASFLKRNCSGVIKTPAYSLKTPNISFSWVHLLVTESHSLLSQWIHVIWTNLCWDITNLHASEQSAWIKMNPMFRKVPIHVNMCGILFHTFKESRLHALCQQHTISWVETKESVYTPKHKLSGETESTGKAAASHGKWLWVQSTSTQHKLKLCDPPQGLISMSGLQSADSLALVDKITKPLMPAVRELKERPLCVELVWSLCLWVTPTLQRLHVNWRLYLVQRWEREYLSVLCLSAYDWLVACPGWTGTGYSPPKPNSEN